MARLMFIFYLLSFYYQVDSQIIKSPLSFLSSRPYNDAIIELPRNIIDAPRNFIDVPRNLIDMPTNFFDVPRNFIHVPRNLIDIPRNFVDVTRNFIDVPRPFCDGPRIIETPRNVIQPQPVIVEQPIINPPTTVITDCTPSVCKNLADTINLMIVSNLLQNTLGDLKTLKMAAPLLKNIMSNPALASCPGVISNLVNPNFIAPNFVAPNVVAPRLVAPGPVAPNPNVPINNSAMLSNILKMIGNPV